MFLNLVRGSLIRLAKNRALPSSVLGALVISIIFIATLRGGAVFTYVDDELIGTILAPNAMVMFNILGSLISGVVSLISTAFFVSDYYRYRLAINIEGSVRSRVKLTLSEITALFIWMLLWTLMVATLGIGLIVLVYGASVVQCSFIRLLILAVIRSMQVFLTCMEVLVIAKIVRRATITLAVFVAYSVVYMIIDSIVVAVLDENIGLTVSALILPGSYLSMVYSNIELPSIGEVMPMFVSYGVIIFILSTLACVASCRKDRI